MTKSSAWGGKDFPIIAAHGQHASWERGGLYDYTKGYGMDGDSHPGVDVQMPVGTTLYALADGVVDYIRQESYGTREVVIRPANGHRHLYTHTSAQLVKAGDKVKAGQAIARSGDPTGLPHLHFEHRVPDASQREKWRIVDPMPLLTGAPASTATYTPLSSIVGAILGTPEVWIAWAKQNGVKRLDEFEKYVRELYRLAHLRGGKGPQPHKLITQMLHETGGGTSSWWIERLNPAGIGITGDKKQNAASKHFADGVDAARAHYYHASEYSDYPVAPEIAVYRSHDPRAGALPEKLRGIRNTLESYGTDDPVNNPSWAVDIEYGTKWAKWLNRLAPVFSSDTPAPPQPDPPPDNDNGGNDMADHRYGIGMGHRNINYGGAWGEFDWTPSCARALKEAIEARGGKAYLFQEHDGDNDPNFSTGKGLQAAARVGSDTIVNRYGPLTAIFFCHYNGGGGAGAHFIYPDGWVAPDRGVDNPLDIKLSTAIKRHLAKTNTVGFLHWSGWLGPEPGVMSERNTGAVANRYGYRLGELVGTIQHRSTTPRLIIEAGSIDTSERKYITNPAWVRHVYAEAIVDALEEVFGAMPKPKPQEPEKPESVYVTPIQRKWADDAIKSGVPFVDLPDKNHPAGRTRWWRVDRNYITVAEVARQQVATDSSKFLNEPIPAKTPIWVDFAGENYEDEPYGLTPWGTMVRMDNLRVIDWPNQPDLYAVNVNEVIDILEDVLDDA